MIRFYLSLRRQVSLLLERGHVHARQYPIAVVWSEARIVRQRDAQQLITEATAMHSAIGAVLAGPKEFEKMLKRISDVG